MARKKTGDAKKTKLLADQAAALADYAAKALVAAGHLRVKSKAIESFHLNDDERATLADLPGLPARLKTKLATTDASFTVAESVSLLTLVADSLLDAGPKQQAALLLIARKVIDGLQATIVQSDLPAKGKTPKPADTVFQFKITLLGSQPPVWRRIQVRDCTLDKLHEHIQTAMGWTNSHLHHFRLGEHYYGDPTLIAENFEALNYKDSTTTMLSDIVPKKGRRFRFLYEYDFGDSWEHELMFEGYPNGEAERQYPVCLEGERACPPEDVGGVRGYADFLEAIGNAKHEQHDEMLEWVGGRFDPEAFDPAAATKRMKKGLPDWRRGF